MAALKDLISAAAQSVANAAGNTAKQASSSGGSSASAARSSNGGSVYDQSSFTDDELRSAAEIRAAAEAGKTTWDDAHSYVEGIRNKYGYSGGDDGSGYNKISQDIGEEEFSYESAPSYVNKYQGKIDQLTQDILNREAFSYDPEKDDTYQQYKESYTRSGQRAMQDTMGQMSARTGGLASSYAGSASQQTYDGYMSALADKIPELKQLAYSMYQDEGNNQRANLDMLMALEQGDYAKYADLLGQYNNDRNFNYGVFSDDRNYDYRTGRDEISDSRYEDETAYNREQDEWEKSNYASETEYNKALEKAQTLAAAGDFSGFKALGYTDAEIANLKTSYTKAQAAASSSGSRGSGSSGGSKSGGTSQSADSNIYETLKKSGATDYGTAYAMLLQAGYGVTAAKELATYFADSYVSGGEGGSNNAPSFNDYSEAVSYMQQNGVPGGNASGAMTKSEWARRKSSLAQYGQGGTEVKDYNSYSEYLTAYVQYCIETYGK